MQEEKTVAAQWRKQQVRRRYILLIYYIFTSAASVLYILYIYVQQKALCSSEGSSKRAAAQKWKFKFKNLQKINCQVEARPLQKRKWIAKATKKKSTVKLKRSEGHRCEKKIRGKNQGKFMGGSSICEHNRLFYSRYGCGGVRHAARKRRAARHQSCVWQLMYFSFLFIFFLIPAAVKRRSLQSCVWELIYFWFIYFFSTCCRQVEGLATRVTSPASDSSSISFFFF